MSALEVITLANGDLCARNENHQHLVIAHVVTQPNSPGGTPERLREKAAAYLMLADAVEQGWDQWAEARAGDRARMRRYLTSGEW
ncbi:hypothetical protein [Tsukamurella tyrosinosolvens]|uniref:hypothetical protein n=1 Tax=Tsukamurella tyrosinosolvens TaxID=57704 RepID=UPI002DD426D6|nr:hypothetical protein [Tsukamurella tyrosinosolvens]MEC4616279.1 hypothetical protein [Tsukamurella tyrosinosolvens]